MRSRHYIRTNSMGRAIRRDEIHPLRRYRIFDQFPIERAKGTNSRVNVSPSEAPTEYEPVSITKSCVSRRMRVLGRERSHGLGNQPLQFWAPCSHSLAVRPQPSSACRLFLERATHLMTRRRSRPHLHASNPPRRKGVEGVERGRRRGMILRGCQSANLILFSKCGTRIGQVYALGCRQRHGRETPFSAHGKFFLKYHRVQSKYVKIAMYDQECSSVLDDAPHESAWPRGQIGHRARPERRPR